MSKSPHICLNPQSGILNGAYTLIQRGRCFQKHPYTKHHKGKCISLGYQTEKNLVIGHANKSRKIGGRVNHLGYVLTCARAHPKSYPCSSTSHPENPPHSTSPIVVWDPSVGICSLYHVGTWCGCGPTIG